MNTNEFLRILKEDIHSTVVATVDEDGLPTARVIDIMLVDENSLYFITSTGKEFYNQLMNKKYVAISGMTSDGGTLSKKSISIRGKVENIGAKLLDKVFEENTYMEDIYTTKESRKVLKVFRLYEGIGEYFDLTTKPITRLSFVIGEKNYNEYLTYGYLINTKCVGCNSCISVCPQNCIDTSNKPYVIRQENCIRCGNCLIACNYGAVDKR